MVLRLLLSPEVCPVARYLRYNIIAGWYYGEHIPWVKITGSTGGTCNEFVGDCGNHVHLPDGAYDIVIVLSEVALRGYFYTLAKEQSVLFSKF